MKKFCLLLAVLVMISCLAGCGGEDNKSTVEEEKENPITLSELEKSFCDDNEKFSVSGTTATHNWNGRFDRVITAELEEENKVVSIEIVYTDLDTETFKSSKELTTLLTKNKEEWSVFDAMMLLPMWDLADLMTLVGANDSEITNNLVVDVVVNGTAFSKNNWTVQVSVGDNGATFVANYGSSLGA